MQDPNANNSATTTRKPWYQRAMEMASLWKVSLSKSTEIPFPNSSSRNNNIPNRQKLGKSTSLKAATSFTRGVCLCVPISSYAYTDVFQADLAPRRSNFRYPRSKAFPTTTQDQIRTPSARMSTEGRRIFRGKSLTDDVLMRRFVVEEEAMMQVRRRNQMDVIKKRNAKTRTRLGPSPLSRMVLAEEDGF